MNRFRHLSKFFTLFLVLAFLFSVVELHADHDDNDPQQAQHCCVQCCPSHHLAPNKTAEAIIEMPRLVQGTILLSLRVHSSMIPSSIFRPPIFAV